MLLIFFEHEDLGLCLLVKDWFYAPVSISLISLCFCLLIIFWTISLNSGYINLFKILYIYIEQLWDQKTKSNKRWHWMSLYKYYPQMFKKISPSNALSLSIWNKQVSFSFNLDMDCLILPVVLSQIAHEILPVV